jgi:hypothetical protein
MEANASGLTYAALIFLEWGGIGIASFNGSALSPLQKQMQTMKAGRGRITMRKIWSAEMEFHSLSRSDKEI